MLKSFLRVFLWDEVRIAIMASMFMVLTASCSIFRGSGPLPTEAVLEQSPPATPISDSSTVTSSPTSVQPTRRPATTKMKASGPIVFSGDSGVWITDALGASPVQLSAHENRGDLRRAISSGGDKLALIEINEDGLDLVIVQIPSGEKETIAQVLALPREENIENTSPKAFAQYAIRDYDGVAWQPGEGRFLAFTAAIDGPTSDLYLYDTQTKEVTRLTDGYSQAVMPSWSLDGRYILHYGVSWVPPFGGAIVGHNRLDGVWAVDVSSGEIITLPKPDSVMPNFVGWQDDSHYITFDSSEDCGAQNLRTVDVTSGETTRLMNFDFGYYIALSPEDGTLLISSAGECTNSLDVGAYTLLPGQGSPEKIVEERIWGIEWLPESQVFEAYPEALLSPDGETRYDPPVYDRSFNPAISIVGFEAWEIIEDQKSRVEIRVPGGDWRSIFEGRVDVLIWDSITGETLIIVQGDGSLYTATYPDFTTFKQGDLGRGVRQAVWLP